MTHTHPGFLILRPGSSPPLQYNPPLLLKKWMKSQFWKMAFTDLSKYKNMSRYSCNFAAGNFSAAWHVRSAIWEYDVHFVLHSRYTLWFLCELYLAFEIKIQFDSGSQIILFTFLPTVSLSKSSSSSTSPISWKRRRKKWTKHGGYKSIW